METIFRTAGGFPEVIAIRVPRALNDEVERAAAKSGLTKAEYCRRTLARGVAAEAGEAQTA